MLEMDESVGRSETAARLRYLEPGLSLRISDLTDTLGGYACRLVETDGRTLWIDLPIRRDGMLSLSTGQLVSVRFDRPGDAMYLFDSVVSERRDDDHAPFGIAVPVTINRRPHRAYARMGLVLDATFDLDDEVSAAPAKVVDLSAGGVGLICAHELPAGARLAVHCVLPGPDGPVVVDEQTEVQTTSLYGRTPGGATLHQYGLRFLEADDDLRERILSAIIWNLTSNADAG